MDCKNIAVKKPLRYWVQFCSGSKPLPAGNGLCIGNNGFLRNFIKRFESIQNLPLSTGMDDESGAVMNKVAEGLHGVVIRRYRQKIRNGLLELPINTEQLLGGLDDLPEWRRW